jgi:hypothetical protein
MDWILSHLQVVLAVAAAIAYWVNQRKAAAREDKKETPPSSGRSGPARADAGEDERTRRIQEEIRRKIAERRGAAPRPSPAPVATERPVAPPVIAPRPVAQEMARGLRERLEARLAEARARTEAKAQERQRQWEEQEKALEADRFATQRRTAEIAAQAQAAPAPTLLADAGIPGGPRHWSDEMRDRQNLRRAIVLREVLGPPVGLR